MKVFPFYKADSFLHFWNVYKISGCDPNFGPKHLQKYTKWSSDDFLVNLMSEFKGGEEIS